jgi:hypothetical protein
VLGILEENVLVMRRAAMQKLDLKKILKSLYYPSPTKIELVDVPTMSFIKIDGAIEPDQMPGTSPLFQESVQALYGLAYTLKFMFKQRAENPIDYPVMALEGLWWIEDGHFDIRKPGNWKYTLMIMQPDQIKSQDFSEALENIKKKKGELPAFARLRFERFCEGLSVQTMHVGPYASEPETMDRISAFLQSSGYKDLVGMGGKHHEIYIGDPKRSEPSRLKTVLRHPVKKM